MDRPRLAAAAAAKLRLISDFIMKKTLPLQVRGATIISYLTQSSFTDVDDLLFF
jgi:hypothetical protein